MSENPYLDGNFGPVEGELTATDLEVTGTIPAELEGRLLRIGPNPVAPEPASYHWFSGNGMVHGVRLRGGRAEWYRRRYVRDATVAEHIGATPIAGDPGSPFGGVANTNVIRHAGKTYAVVEAGTRPVELTDDLESVKYTDLDGTLPGGFTAHPKRDPDTGELHATVYFFGWDYLQYVVIGTDGRVRKTVEVPVPGRPMTHDCSITANYHVLFDMPVIFKPELMEAGRGLPYEWDQDYGCRVGLLPREGSADDVVWAEVDPCYVFHPMNSYEDADGRVVMDVCRHPKMFATDHHGPNEGPPTLDRWIIDPKGGPVKEERLDDRGQEFPRHYERLIGKPYRFGYTASFEGLDMQGLRKHDLEKRSVEVRNEGAGRQFLEPVFVPRSDDAAEDDGWLLAYVYDKNRDGSDVQILHAQDFTGDPVATIRLPDRVPFGFHGNWKPND